MERLLTAAAAAHGATEGHATASHDIANDDYRTDIGLIVVILMLIWYVISSSFISKNHIGFIHPCAPLVLVSMIFSYSLDVFQVEGREKLTNLVSGTFIYQFLLPPIVLAEGFNVRTSLLRNYGSEMKYFGIIATFMNALLLSGVIYTWVHKSEHSSWIFGLDHMLGLQLSVYEVFALAIVLNSCDAHGAAGPFHGGIHNERMGTITFGSSLFSNNICLIFVMALEKMIHGGTDDSGGIVSNFFKQGALSTVFGASMGMIVTYMMKKASFLNANPIYEVFIILTGTYATYMLAHFPFIGLSGDVAIFFYGMVISNYNIFNMSREAIKQLGIIINVVMAAAEAFCFIFVGLSFEKALDKDWLNLRIAIIFYILTLGIKVLVFSVIALIKISRHYTLKHDPLMVNIPEVFAIVSSSMIKGPVAYIFAEVLVIAIGHSSSVEYIHSYYSNPELKQRPLYITQLTVIISVLIYPFIHYMICSQLCEVEHSSKEECMEEEFQLALKNSLDNKWEIKENPQILLYLDEFKLKPLFVRNYSENKKMLIKKQEYFKEAEKTYSGHHEEHGAHGGHGGGHGHGGHDEHASGHESHFVDEEDYDEYSDSEEEEIKEHQKTHSPHKHGHGQGHH